MSDENKDQGIPKNTKVSLKAKDSKKAKKGKFFIDQANKMLSLSNSKWELDDDRFKWNGSEIAKKPKS